ncbi:hypothetical protein DWX23_02500 [Parabacteroides sp. AF18-52]|jgi:putative transmembrane protein|uniref:hypothetical protein n=1 Tax=Parabacteroides sp. AF18-52 TaxID=2292242 RepID=UPI000F0065D3|nr:hypothetical protein [Parabacteroides sp. AF18-52]RHR43400.1 hypothetical protein DWX23_02500 [Parabacteroides sp. AF18-52]
MKFREITERLKIYESQSLYIPHLTGFWYELIQKLEIISIKNETVPKNPLNLDNRDIEVICSMTSFPGRIHLVHWALKSLLLQSYKPDKILLYLAEEQFPNRDLPQTLLNLQKYGVEICWCHDMYGHKKYFYPVLNQKPNQVIITFDDDIIYPVKCIERLMKTHEKYPNVLVCERAQAINNAPSKIDNPGRWDTISDVGINTPSYSLNPSPGGGCLIPYKAFYKDATNEDLFRKYAYKNDDLWYMFMCAANRTRIIKTRKYHKIFTVSKGSQEIFMAQEAILQNKNAIVMADLKAAYPEAYQRILTDID